MTKVLKLTGVKTYAGGHVSPYALKKGDTIRVNDNAGFGLLNGSRPGVDAGSPIPHFTEEEDKGQEVDYDLSAAATLAPAHPIPGTAAAPAPSERMGDHPNFGDPKNFKTAETSVNGVPLQPGQSPAELQAETASDPVETNSPRPMSHESVNIPAPDLSAPTENLSEQAKREEENADDADDESTGDDADTTTDAGDVAKAKTVKRTRQRN